MASVLNAVALLLCVLLPSKAVQFGGSSVKPTRIVQGGLELKADGIQPFRMRTEHNSTDASYANGGEAAVAAVETNVQENVASARAESTTAQGVVSESAPVQGEVQRGAAINPSESSTAEVADTHVATMENKESWVPTSAALNPAASSTAGQGEAEVQRVSTENPVPFSKAKEASPQEKDEEGDGSDEEEEEDEEEQEEQEEQEKDEKTIEEKKEEGVEEEEKDDKKVKAKTVEEKGEEEEEKEEEEEEEEDGEEEEEEEEEGEKKKEAKAEEVEAEAAHDPKVPDNTQEAEQQASTRDSTTYPARSPNTEEVKGEAEIVNPAEAPIAEEAKVRVARGDQDDDDEVEILPKAGAPANDRNDQAGTESQIQSDPKVPTAKEEVEEEVSVDTGAGAEPAQAEEGSMEFPTDAGCFLRTPSGCPNHPTFSSRGWRHDTYAEKYTHAKENLTECEVIRKARLVAYCGAGDAETLFVPSIWGSQLGEDGTPVEPGCYVRTPSGCPNHPTFNSSVWRHEEYGERATMAKVNRTACEVDRQDSVRHWCGAEDAEMLFIPPPPAGCYVRTPSGCPNHPTFASTEWRHEEYGENFTKAKENRSVCEVDRRMHIAHWCGTISVHMLFVPEQQEEPASSIKRFRETVATPREPGCFMLTPSGCPNHPSFGRDGWEHDRVGELSGARRNRALCEGGRKEQVSQWCGVQDVEALFVPAPEPGCYVRTPSGCPFHPNYGSSNWTHDDFGEKHKSAGVHRIECEVARKVHVAHWCGTDDVQMSFVPPDWESLVIAGMQGGEEGPDAMEPPTQPGCYVRTLSGCPSHPSYSSSQWKFEEHSERSSKASRHQATCQARKVHVAHWCGAEDVEMLFVPTPEPGCYMRTPTGCPNHPEYGSDTWKRDEDGGNATESQTDRKVCEVLRQADIASWCGTHDAEMLFLPPPPTPLPESHAVESESTTPPTPFA